MATTDAAESMSEVTVAWRGRALLGEGPAWDAVEGRLWFVDIKRSRIHRLDPDSGCSDEWACPSQVGWILPATGGTMLAGLRTGLAVFNPRDGSFRHAADVEPHLPGNRLNDAGVDPDGVVWFGTMDDGETDATGRLYRWDGEAVTVAAVDPVRITNGPGVSPDGRTLYHVDTAGGAILAVDLNTLGDVIVVRPFARIDVNDGYPDGATVDSAGNVWVGLWGGWRARLYSPAGTVLREVPLPASNITKIALGGADLRTAFATSARIGLDAADLLAQPEAGGVFSFRVDEPGQAAAPARLPRRAVE